MVSVSIPRDTRLTTADLVTRILYRLRLAGEQRAFDAVSLIYMLPLVQVVISKRGVGGNDQDKAEEQITLALEFLALHSDLCKCGRECSLAWLMHSEARSKICREQTFSKP